jgi:hypothetical protein
MRIKAAAASKGGAHGAKNDGSTSAVSMLLFANCNGLHRAFCFSLACIDLVTAHNSGRRRRWLLRDDGTFLGGGVLNYIVAIGECGRRECYQEQASRKALGFHWSFSSEPPRDQNVDRALQVPVCRVRRLAERPLAAPPLGFMFSSSHARAFTQQEPPAATGIYVCQKQQFLEETHPQIHRS